MMELLFMQVLNMSISAGWMIIAVLVLRLLLRRMPKWLNVSMWGLVGLRLALPFSVKSAFSLLPSAKTISPAIQYAQHPAIQSGVQSIDNTVNPMLGSSLAANPANSVNPVQVWLFAGSVIWIIGLLVFLLYSVFSYVHMKRKVRASIPMEQGVLISDEVTIPFVLGILRPMIYLPSGMDEAEQSYVLAHERAHLSRGDHIWKPLGFLLLAVHWFNPLAWLSYVLMCRDIELACDERVIRDLNLQEKKEYAHALVSCSLQRRMVMVCPLAFGEVGVKQRVKEVLHYRKPAFWIVTGAVVACAAVAVCFLTDPVQKNFDLTIHIPKDADGDSYFFSDEEVSPLGNKLTVLAGADMPDGEVVLRPSNGDGEDQISYLTGGMPVSFQVKKGAWYQVGIRTGGGSLDYLLQVKKAAVRIAPDYPEIIEQYRTDYVGDAPKVSQIAMRLPYPEGYAYHHIEIQSSAEPYGLTIYLTGSGEVASEDFNTCSDLAFDLIGNLGWIKYQSMDNDDVSFRHDKDAQVLSENAWDKIPAVMVDGQLYYSTGQERTGFDHGDDMDGEITSTVDGTEFPTENNQSNFGTGYVYQLEAGGMLDVQMDGQWIIFTPKDDYEARFNTSPDGLQSEYEWNQLPAPEIDYGTSSLYSREDMDAAIGVILTEFSTWEGFELHNIRYTSDDCNSPEHIRWLNDLNESAEGGRNLGIIFTQCIEFVGDYHSPKDADLAGAWKVDEEYENWQWWLGRSEPGEWYLIAMDN